MLVPHRLNSGRSCGCYLFYHTIYHSPLPMLEQFSNFINYISNAATGEKRFWCLYSKDSQCQVARVSSHEGSLRWWSGRTTPFVLQDLGRCYNFCNMLRMQFQVLILWFCNRETVKFEIVSLFHCLDRSMCWQLNIPGMEYAPVDKQKS